MGGEAARSPPRSPLSVTKAASGQGTGLPAGSEQSLGALVEELGTRPSHTGSPKFAGLIWGASGYLNTGH